MKAEKQKVILLFCELRSGHFGMGSHVSVLIQVLKGFPEIDFRIVKTDDRKHHKIGWSYEDGLDILHIPQPENGLFLTEEDTVVQQAYARRIVEIIILQTGISYRDKPIFITNTPDYLNVAACLRESTRSKIVYIQHSWSWKYVCNLPDEVASRLLLNREMLTKDQEHDKTLLLRSLSGQHRMAQLATYTIVVTDQAKRFFVDVLGISKHRITRIYNGIDFQEIVADTRTSLRNKFGFSPEEKIVLYAGRIKEDKGIGYLLEAFRIVVSKGDNVRLILAGSGDIEKFMQMTRSFWNKVTFTGKLVKAEIEKLYVMADVGVLPSLHEQCSFSGLEMRSFRVPSIVSAVDGLDEMYEHERDCLKIKVSTDERGRRMLCTDELAENILRLISDKHLSQELTDKAFNKGIQAYSLDRMIDGYDKFFKSLLDKNTMRRREAGVDVLDVKL